jgi:WD40 repeat protein
MSFNPKIGSLESMQVNMDNTSMLVASTDHGVAVKCNPLTGKVSHRHLLYSTNESIRLQLTAVATDANRIAWGFDHGYVTLSTRNKSTTRLRIFSDFHQGPVKLLALSSSQDIVASGGQDGLVKLWDVTTASCAWTLHAVSALAREPTCLKITNDHRVLIGYDDGSMVIWHINLNQLVQLHHNRHKDDYAVKRAEQAREWESKKVVMEAPINEARCAVKCISYDDITQQVIVAYSGQTEIYKYCTNTGACVGVFAYGHATGANITCMQWDRMPVSTILSLESALRPRPASSNGTRKKISGGIIDLSSTPSSPASSSQPTSGQGTPLNAKTTRLLVTGDDIGTICLWNGDQVSEDNRTIKPLRVFNDGHISPISSIYVDACKVITGSDDGWIRMWDPLTGININTLGNKIPKNAPVDRTDVDMMRVKNIWCNDYQGIATIGHQVKTWDFSPSNQLLMNRRTLKQKGKPSGNAMARDRIRYEIDREVKESIKKLETEKMERAREEKQINKFSLGLTDEEMLDYAMMLSKQEEKVSSSSLQDPTIGASDFIDENDEELMKAVIASLEHQQLEQDQNSDFSIDSESSYSQSTSIDEWPTAAEASYNNIHENVDEDMDEELRYILELSKTDK